MTTPDDVERELYRPIAETARAADQWLALALRKIARDPQMIDAAYRAVEGTGEFIPMSLQDVIKAALGGVADALEEGI